VSVRRGTDVVSAEDRDLARENERLRREFRILLAKLLRMVGCSACNRRAAVFVINIS